MTYLTLRSQAHHQMIEAQLAGFAEEAAEEAANGERSIDGARIYGKAMNTIIDFLAVQRGQQAYPVRIDLSICTPGMRADLAEAVGNIHDCGAPTEEIIATITDDDHTAWLRRRAPDYGFFPADRPVGVRDAILAAYERCEAAGEHPGVLATLAALLAQQGCEHFDPAVTDGWLTHLCDIAIFG
jgi:hypothetical protein